MSIRPFVSSIRCLPPPSCSGAVCAACVNPRSRACRVCPRSVWCGRPWNCGRRISNVMPGPGVPMSFVHTLAFPLHLLLLTSPTFPWPASGMVHLANRIRQYRRLQPGQALRLQVHCERWVAHPKGQALLIVSQAHSDGSLVWESESLYLRRGVAAPVGDPWQADRALDEQALILTQRWSLAADLGRRFAKVSGDHNPIHTSWPGARLFGFKRPIAHGMWTGHWTQPGSTASSSCRCSCPAVRRYGRHRPAGRTRSLKYVRRPATSRICAIASKPAPTQHQGQRMEGKSA